MRYRKILSLLLALLTLALCGCAVRGAEPQAADGKPHIVVTIYPVWDWVREMLGEKSDEVELTLLLDDGVDMHSFQPTVADMAAVASCDLLIYVGGESDEWIGDVEPVNADQRRVSLLELLGDGVFEEELREGMQGEADGAADEHVWLSPKRARALCAALLPYLRDLRLDARYLDASTAAYEAKLDALDEAYAEAASAAARRTLLFADRFPFRYLAEDYGLDYYAAFPGCEAETEASFRTVAFLAGKLDELALPCVLTIETGDGKLARTVLDSSAEPDRPALTLHSMQGPCGGRSYLEIMEENLTVLKEALN